MNLGDSRSLAAARGPPAWGGSDFVGNPAPDQSSVSHFQSALCDNPVPSRPVRAYPSVPVVIGGHRDSAPLLKSRNQNRSLFALPVLTKLESPRQRVPRPHRYNDQGISED